MHSTLMHKTALATTLVLGLVASRAAGIVPLVDHPIPPGLTCPGSTVYSSGATVYFGPYQTEEEAEADVENKQQKALDDAEDAAEASCPENCSPPNSTETCYGEADFDDQTATGVVIPRHNDYLICVVLNINKSYDCKCDI